MAASAVKAHFNEGPLDGEVRETVKLWNYNWEYWMVSPPDENGLVRQCCYRRRAGSEVGGITEFDWLGWSTGPSREDQQRTIKALCDVVEELLERVKTLETARLGPKLIGSPL